MRCLGNTHRRITYVSSFVHHELSLFDTFQDIRSNLLATNAIPVSSNNLKWTLSIYRLLLLK